MKLWFADEIRNSWNIVVGQPHKQMFKIIQTPRVCPVILELYPSNKLYISAFITGFAFVINSSDIHLSSGELNARKQFPYRLLRARSATLRKAFPRKQCHPRVSISPFGRRSQLLLRPAYLTKTAIRAPFTTEQNSLAPRVLFKSHVAWGPGDVTWATRMKARHVWRVDTILSVIFVHSDTNLCYIHGYQALFKAHDDANFKVSKASNGRRVGSPSLSLRSAVCIETLPHRIDQINRKCVCVWAGKYDIISHSMENVAFRSLLRWKMIILPILTP